MTQARLILPDFPCFCTLESGVVAVIRSMNNHGGRFTATIVGEYWNVDAGAL
jgi:hypothetical protein